MYIQRQLVLCTGHGDDRIFPLFLFFSVRIAKISDFAVIACVNVFGSRENFLELAIAQRSLGAPHLRVRRVEQSEHAPRAPQ